MTSWSAEDSDSWESEEEAGKSQKDDWEHYLVENMEDVVDLTIHEFISAKVEKARHGDDHPSDIWRQMRQSEEQKRIEALPLDCTYNVLLIWCYTFMELPESFAELLYSYVGPDKDEDNPEWIQNHYESDKYDIWKFKLRCLDMHRGPHNSNYWNLPPSVMKFLHENASQHVSFPPPPTQHFTFEHVTSVRKCCCLHREYKQEFKVLLDSRGAWVRLEKEESYVQTTVDWRFKVLSSYILFCVVALVAMMVISQPKTLQDCVLALLWWWVIVCGLALVYLRVRRQGGLKQCCWSVGSKLMGCCSLPVRCLRGCASACLPVDLALDLCSCCIPSGGEYKHEESPDRLDCSEQLHSPYLILPDTTV